MRQQPITQNLPKTLPETAGVYIFRDEGGMPIYIGKAKNLKNRVSSYFAKGLVGKTAAMREEAKLFSFIKVSTEIEALLLEAKLVRSFLPKYNAELKDDKSPLYIGITKDLYPRVIALRKTQIDQTELKHIFGPFVQAGSVRSVMRNLRKIFPYTTHHPSKRVCIYRQIGLCYPCPSEIESETNARKKAQLTKQFKKNIHLIKRFLSGELNWVKTSLQREMRSLAEQEQFEAAAKVKEQLIQMERLTTSHVGPEEYVKDPNFVEDIRNRELEELKTVLRPYIPIEKLQRIECFDIAHLSGTFPTASMVTFVSGDPDKNYYRHFKVKKLKGNSDVDSMKHILERRLMHISDWGRPDLIIVDGGKPQVSVALEVVKDVPLVGLAKQFETFVIKHNDKFIEIRLPNGPAKNLVQRMRDEAHRFARRLHHKHVSKALIRKN